LVLCIYLLSLAMMQQSLVALVVASAAAEMSFEEFQFKYGKVYNEWIH